MAIGGKVHLVARKGAQASAAVRSSKAKRRAADIGLIVEGLQAGGAVSLRQIAASLNQRHIRTARGGEWTATQVMRVLSAQKTDR